MADKRLADYIKNTIEKGYTEEAVRSVILKAGYSDKDFNDTLRELIVSKQESFAGQLLNNSLKSNVVFVYSLISLTLGYFAAVYISLNISSKNAFDYVLLVSMTLVWSYITYFSLVKVVSGKMLNLGYIIQLGVIIDIFLTKKIIHPYLGIITVLFLFSISYYGALEFNKA